MTFLSDVSALVRVGLVFVLIIVAIRKKLSLGNSFFWLPCIGLVVFGMLYFWGLHWTLGWI